MAKRTSVTFVVMAGGKGQRLWPLVRRNRPKVCLAPGGTQTLLSATIERLRPVWPGAEWLIVTTQDQVEQVRRCLPKAIRRQLLVEPQVKNTAAAITLAAVALASEDPQRVMVVVPADHWIGDVAHFQACIRRAIEAAVRHDTIVTIGIRPTAPHPGLGYLRAGESVDGEQAPKVHRLKQFIEKPSASLVKELIRQQDTFWNSGTFVGTSDKFLECVTEWLPNHTRRLVPLAPAVGHRGFTQRARAAYRALESISFDYGVMDYLKDGLIVEGRFAWADLGSWDSWAQVVRTSNEVLAIDGQRITVVSEEPHLVATIGLSDLLVVHTANATLICPPEQAQRLREIVERLNEEPRFAPYR